MSVIRPGCRSRKGDSRQGRLTLYDPLDDPSLIPPPPLTPCSTDMEELVAKVQQLEERLNDKKEALLEKELILDEISGLSDKLRAQVCVYVCVGERRCRWVDNPTFNGIRITIGHLLIVY